MEKQKTAVLKVLIRFQQTQQAGRPSHICASSSQKSCYCELLRHVLCSRFRLAMFQHMQWPRRHARRQQHSIVLAHRGMTLYVCDCTGLNEVEDAYEEDKQRGHIETVSLADRDSAQHGKEEAAQAAQGGSSSNGSSNSSCNGNGRVSSYIMVLYRSYSMLDEIVQEIAWSQRVPVDEFAIFAYLLVLLP